MAFDANDEADKKIVQDMIDEAVKGLKTKNAELLDEVKQARKGKEIDPAKLEALESELDKVKEQLATAEKASKDHAKAAEKATKALEGESNFTTKLLVENGLTAELVKAGVASQFLPAVKSLLAPLVKIAIDGDDRKALVGDKPLAEYITTWSQGDDGKHYIAAANNGGGGAQGGGAANNKSVTRAAFATMDATAQMEHAKSGGTVTD